MRTAQCVHIHCYCFHRLPRDIFLCALSVRSSRMSDSDRPTDRPTARLSFDGAAAAQRAGNSGQPPTFGGKQKLESGGRADGRTGQRAGGRRICDEAITSCLDSYCRRCLPAACLPPCMDGRTFGGKNRTRRDRKRVRSFVRSVVRRGRLAIVGDTAQRRKGDKKRNQ